ncbi:MAG: hypothetical protein HY22_01130 [[Candidatus Thermochlorobacteriaceae] bacterium GBChlB]|nr:MAG: hypothetical protein HY22_01130 [[Candidatus Thermochlorobacteriaceae] bacterium GBChlB]
MDIAVLRREGACSEVTDNFCLTKRAALFQMLPERAYFPVQHLTSDETHLCPVVFLKLAIIRTKTAQYVNCQCTILLVKILKPKDIMHPNFAETVATHFIASCPLNEFLRSAILG